MAHPRSAPFHPRVWFGLAAIVVGLVVLGVWFAKPAPPVRVLVLASSMDSPDQELGPGMEILVSDCLEVITGATVTYATTLPTQADLRALPPSTVLLRFKGRREGERLALTLEWNTPAGLLSNKPGTRDALAADDPRTTLEQMVRHWPLSNRHRRLGRLIPASPAHFWRLLEGLSIHDDQVATDHLGEAQKLVDEAPECAMAWVALGDQLYRSLWVNPEKAGIGLSSRTHHAFQKAVELVPGYPRATFLWSMMLTDTGNQGLALKALREAIRLRPGEPDLYLGVSYASRTSGLLEGARRALAHRASLMGPLDTPTSWFAETTYLYLGDLDAFGRELARAGSLRQDASIFFYRGYYALLLGQPKPALEFMRSGSDPGMTPTPFRDLCRVYMAYLEGRPKDGLTELREIDDVRGKLRIPDGEWTFKEAEAYSLLGDADRGIDCATRAFVQGFSCAAWYEKSPFLAKVREHPRWPMLRRNVRERQAVLGGSYPPSAFEP